MTDALLASENALFQFSVLQSLVAIACLGSLYAFGVESCLHVATAAATFVYCSLGQGAPVRSEEV